MIHITGHTDKDGRLYIDGRYAMDNYLRQFPSQKVLIKIETMPEKASDRAVYYYQYAILPQIQKGFKELGQYLTLEQIDTKMRQQFVGTLEEQILGNRFINSIKPVEELDKETLIHYFDFLRIYAADNLKVQLYDYRTI